MKIFLTGSSGQIGFELLRSLSAIGRESEWKIIAPQRSALDLTDMLAVESALEQAAPDLIINAAAYTAVDQAESEPVLAGRLNAELPRQLAEFSVKKSCGLIHISSDYVYAGKGA